MKNTEGRFKALTIVLKVFSRIPRDSSNHLLNDEKVSRAAPLFQKVDKDGSRQLPGPETESQLGNGLKIFFIVLQTEYFFAQVVRRVFEDMTESTVITAVSDVEGPSGFFKHRQLIIF